jgi:D-alanine transaminase
VSRIAYVSGRYVPHAEARVAIEDRGYQLADGVYDVAPVAAGAIIDLAPHLDRLDYSLRELAIAQPMPRAALALVCAETVARNRVGEGIVYVQVTRGVAPRDHGFPTHPVRPALVVTAKALRWPDRAVHDPGIGVLTVPDLRWGRCDIKAIALVANVLAKQQARAAGAYEAWFVRPDGTIAEGASTNAWIVDAEGCVVTRPLGRELLAGITRATVLRLARDAGYQVRERAFGRDELATAREAFLTSTTNLVRAVVAVDGRPIANGHPGEVARTLRDRCIAHYRAGRAA